MTSFLRQSTASQSRALGPFVDDTDFKTAKTGLTIANTDIKLVVNGAASANKNSGGGTHRVNGVYGVTFDATDSATVGEMEVNVVVSGALPVFDKFTVLEEVVYDALLAASAPGFLQPGTAGRTLLVDASGQVTVAAITASANNDIADNLLNRDMSAVSDTNARSPLNALRFIRNKWSVSSGTLTVTKENDSTSAWTASITTDAAAIPITGSDPS